MENKEKGKKNKGEKMEDFDTKTNPIKNKQKT